jgi:hypothetical protein
VTQRDYLLELIRRDQAVPLVEDWLERVRQLRPIPTSMTGAEAVAAARQEREAELDERYRRVRGR